MKLFRHGPIGAEKPGLVAADGSLRDLSGVLSEIAGDALSDRGLDRLRAMDAQALPRLDGVRFGVPVSHVPNILGIGRNYAAHAKELGNATPAEPLVFNKHTGSMAGAHDAIVLPEDLQKADWEVELAVVIGRSGLRVSEADALDYVAGYLICNDISERHLQLDGTGQFVKGKSYPGFAPLGPYLVTRDEIPDPQALALRFWLNGEIMQDGRTADMIFSVAEIISYVSRFLRLMPGDILTTGTPSGVGQGRTPPRFLTPGDRIAAEVDGLGRQEAAVISA